MQETNTKIRILVGLNVVLMLIVAVLVFPVAGRNYMATTIGTNVSTAGLTATSSVTTPAVDNSGAVTLGGTNATSVGIGRTGVTSTVNGPLTVTGTSTLNGTAALNGITTIGDAGDTIALNSSDWGITATGVTTGLGNITSDGRITSTGPYNLATAGTALTIATDIITVTKSYHAVDTEAAAASDNLVTINGGAEGDLLLLRPANDARTVVVKDGAGIDLAGNSDFSMDDIEDTITLYNDGTNWNEVSRSATMDVPRVRVYNSAAQSISNTITTAVTFDSERYDSDNIHSTSTNTGRLTAATAGTYLIQVHIEWAPNATGLREMYIRLNGTTLLAHEYNNANTVSNGQIFQNVSTAYFLNATDYVEVVVNQNSGVSLNVSATGNRSPEFMMTKIAD